MTANSDAALALLDQICQDSLETTLDATLANRQGSMEQQVTSLFVRLADEIDRLAAAAERAEEARIRATLTRLDDAKTVGRIFDHSREALEAAYAELERAEQHHRWHHEQEGREVEEDDERLRVLMVIAEALEELPEPLREDAETQVHELHDRAAALAQDAEQTPDSMMLYLLKEGQRGGKYTLVAHNLAFGEAARLVQALRRDPRVYWAYCTEPDVMS